MLTEIAIQDNQALASGHFGEIWKGVFRGRPVCMKVVKVYQKSDVAKLLKVSIGGSISICSLLTSLGT